MIQQQQQKTSQWVLTSVQFNLVKGYNGATHGYLKQILDKDGK